MMFSTNNDQNLSEVSMFVTFDHKFQMSPTFGQFFKLTYNYVCDLNVCEDEAGED